MSLGSSHVSVAGCVACVVASLFAMPRPAAGCAPAWSGEVPVQIAHEEALIVWDGARKLEHFVRTATFEGGPPSFGFLVPVPSLPELAEADEQIFERIEKFWEAQRPEEVRWRFDGFTSLTLRTKSALAPASAGPTVLAETRVAGMDAVVLEAESARSLGDWLVAREFSFRSELVAWLEPYVAERYKIVAFKYARDAGTPRVGARAVRLSFHTDRPFFPYREPRDAARLVPATFRLHVISTTSMRAVLGEARAPWEASVRYAGPFLAEPPPFARVASPWITMFEETAQKRVVAGDLFLEPTAAPTPVAATPRVEEKTWGIPMELALLGVVVAGITVALIARGRHEGGSGTGRSGPGARTP